MSTRETGVQWDYPFGWAPMQLLAVEGLRRYGYKAEADRISYKFLSMVLINFVRDGNIREKYDVVSDSIELQACRRLPRQHRRVRLDQRCFSRTPAHPAGGIFEPLNRNPSLPLNPEHERS
jgi:neutral trehalase